MRKCVLNDCCGPKRVAPCCLDCPLKNRCLDRCPKSDTIYCVGLIEEDDKEDKT